ncbi:unnamed protein product [Arabis nemorensis]|uniref:Gnk2-homologous domain-containing protein n=1 Tax=Arabis nemorensis TaxID=586526 RepID=A0A565AW81_9BRAS|nr:unnamed protein product [Arabis nemorensis]
MGRNITKKMMVLVLLLHLLMISSSSGLDVKTPNANGEGERFSPYESQGKTPKSADSDSKVFHGKTCYSAVKGYMGLFDLLECLICDLNVEIQSGHRVFDTYLSSNQVVLLSADASCDPEVGESCDNGLK